MSIWKKLFVGGSKPSQPSASALKENPAMWRYDGGSVEGFYARMSKALIAKYGPLVSVDCKSHFPKFEIWFCYKDNIMRVYSGERTGHYDIHFLSLGYVGEGPRYARHFLAAAGFDLTVDEIESIRPGDSIVMRDGKAVIMRKNEKLVEGGEVTFLREETRLIEGASATYRYYKAPSKAAALDFLNKQNIIEQMFYVAVEAPDGRWVKDWMGIFDA